MILQALEVKNLDYVIWEVRDITPPSKPELREGGHVRMTERGVSREKTPRVASCDFFFFFL
jgi:hypothetical protein